MTCNDPIPDQNDDTIKKNIQKLTSNDDTIKSPAIMTFSPDWQ